MGNKEMKGKYCCGQAGGSREEKDHKNKRKHKIPREHQYAS